MHSRSLVTLCVCALIIAVTITAQDTTTQQNIPEKTTEKKGKVQVPPLSNGGVAALWFREHEFVQDEFGEFELLNYSNAGHSVARDSIKASTWKLVAMGNFLPGKAVQFATLARLKKHEGSVMLIMFEWVPPADTTRKHGVFYHTVIKKESLLLRTRQGLGGTVDTLEFSCDDLERPCGRAYYDGGEIKLSVIDKDR